MIETDNSINSQQTARIEFKKQEILILLSEYDALRSEIITLLEASRQILNITVTLIGIFLAGIPLIIDTVNVNGNITRYMLLIIPLFFYGLAWTQLKYLMSTLDIGHYLQNYTIKQIRERLLALHIVSFGTRYKSNDLMQWEELPLSRVKRFGFLRLPITASHYSVPIGGGIISFIIYFLIIPQGIWFDLTSIFLIAINTLAFFYSLIFGFIIEMDR